MIEGYYKIIQVTVLINGIEVVKQGINYYNLQKELQFQEFYSGSIRPEFSVELTEE